MDLWIGTLNLGFLYAFMAIGTYITYKLYSFPDITIDGTFTTGAAVASILIVDGWNPFMVLPVTFVAGSLAGFITGFIHTRFKVEGLLAGILVMTGLYSVNLHIMGKSNVPLLNTPTFVTIVEHFNPGLDAELWVFLFLTVVIIFFWMIMALFLKTDYGLTMQATGNNPVMVSAQGISINRVKIFGISLANGLVGISGAMVAQYQGFADIGMGIGSIIFSLASVIIGEAILRRRSMFVKILGVILGSIIFRLAVAFALTLGLNPNDLKILTALFVLATIIATNSLGKTNSGFLAFIRSHRSLLAGALFSIAVLYVGYSILKEVRPVAEKQKMVKIGVIMSNQSSLLTNTLQGFRDEMKRMGYIQGENIDIIELNAEGDIPANRTMVDHLISEQVDLFLPISTASTQAVINKVKQKPVVFATVADPFSIDAGVDPEHHLPNVTGVYGSAPIRELLEIITEIYPGKIRIGTIYNPAFPNTKVNLRELKHVLRSFPNLTLDEVAVSGTNDVYQAAQSLAGKHIKAFCLINDLTVFNSLESVIKISRQKKIPVFSNDAERITDGVLLVYGYEYYVSGVQAAHLVNRILKGESPAKIPFEIYNSIVCGINDDVAKQMNIRFPEKIRNMANIIIQNGKMNRKALPAMQGGIDSTDNKRQAIK